MHLFDLLDELRILSKNGLRYANDPHDEERYRRIMELTSQYYGEALDLPPAEARDRFAEELGHTTPKIGSQAGLFDPEGRILLLRRDDDETWCLPCGWVEPNESPAETAVRETREETGLEVRVLDLVDLFYHSPGENGGPHGKVDVLYLCEKVGGTLELSEEGEKLEYWSIDAVPTWHQAHETFARDARTVWKRCER